MSKIKPRVVSLFSGCGGIDLGFHKAGFDIVFANDIEKNVKATYNQNLGEILIKDITKVDIDKEIPNDVDVVLAGIPCQPFSTAGSRKGMEDDRGGLFERVISVIRHKKPKIVLFENVKGFLSAKDDSGLPMPERIEKELSLCGYKAYWQLLNAVDYEVPQNRQRIIIVGVRNNLVNPFIFPEKVSSVDLSVGSVIKDSKLIDEIHEVWALSPQSQNLCPHIPAGGSWKNIPDEFLPERLKKIRADMKKYHSPNFYRRFNLNEIMGTVTASATPENSGILHPLEHRRYSVREIARFQSFPDSFKFVGCPISAKYKMIGNAVPPNLAYHIARAILSQYF